MSSRHGIRECVDSFYKLAAEPAGIDDALTKAANLFHGDVAQFAVFSPKFTRISSRIVGGLPGVQKKEAEYYAMNPRWRAAHGLAAGQICCDYSHSTQHEIDRDPTYQELLKPNHTNWYAGAQLMRDSRGAVTIGLCRGGRSGHFSRNELDLFRIFVRHASNAISLLYDLQARRNADIIESVNGLSKRCAILDAQGRVIAASEAFLDSAGNEAVFEIGGDRSFHINDACAAKSLGVLLRACAPDAEIDAPQTANLVLARAPQGGLWRLRGSSLPRIAEWMAGAGVCLITLEEISLHSLGCPGVLERAFQLTEAEARLAVYMADGKGLPRAAIKRGVSYETARSQAKQIFAKTGCRNQSELCALVARIFAN